MERPCRLFDDQMTSKRRYQSGSRFADHDGDDLKNKKELAIKEEHVQIDDKHAQSIYPFCSGDYDYDSEEKEEKEPIKQLKNTVRGHDQMFKQISCFVDVVL